MKVKKEKSKSSLHKQGLAFVALWSMSYAALWLVLFISMYLHTNDSTIRGRSVDIADSVGILVAAGLVAFMQQRLLRRPALEWVLTGLLGTLVTLGLFNTVAATPDPSMLLPSLALLVPTSLVQMIWLRQHVKSAWFWPLTNIVAAMSFAFLFRGDNAASMNYGFIVLGLLQGIVQAVVMRYLWSHPQEIEIAEQQIDIEELAHQQAIERLNPYETPEEIVNETPLAQRLTQE